MLPPSAPARPPKQSQLLPIPCSRCSFRAAELICSSCHTPKTHKPLIQQTLPFKVSPNTLLSPANPPSFASPIPSPVAPPTDAPPSCDYDPSLISTWIFPQSDEYATRQYQINIVSSAIMRNTMVVLPTGLGKTFIAAVVMYNYLRWFPRSKIIFTAPTRPLVTQQVQACHDVVGIREEETAEMSGQVDATRRGNLWKTRRVFYCTPQVIQKDLAAGLVPIESISLVVVDEAHKAVGHYAYTVMIEEMARHSRGFRILALSATPGKDKDKVQEILTNLRIEALEYKSETDPDVQPYVFQKMLEVIQVDLNAKCLGLIALLNDICADKLRRLKASGHFSSLPSDVSKLSSYLLTTMLQSFSPSTSNIPAALFYPLQSDLSLLASLMHARTLLTAHGVSALRSHLRLHYEGEVKKYKRGLIATPEWARFVRFIDEAIAQGGANPKIDRLITVLTDHFERFTEAGKRTSVIVFAQFRDSVAEICGELARRTALRVSPFVGQSSVKASSGGKSEEQLRPSPDSVSTKGQTQREQQDIVAKFRRNEIDVLVATCIGEEGLDIGSVDLVVSFDALASPVRMVQRLGRAGRKRAGRIVVLVADEKEKETLSSGTKLSTSVHKLLREGLHRLVFFKEPHGMLPKGLRPEMVTQTLEIAAYRSEDVGGRRSKRAKRDQLTEPEEAFLAETYGLDLVASPLPHVAPDLVDFRAPVHLVGLSGRTRTVQRTRLFIETGDWGEDAEVLTTRHDKHKLATVVVDDDDDLLNTVATGPSLWQSTQAGGDKERQEEPVDLSSSDEEEQPEEEVGDVAGEGGLEEKDDDTEQGVVARPSNAPLESVARDDDADDDGASSASQLSQCIDAVPPPPEIFFDPLPPARWDSLPGAAPANSSPSPIMHKPAVSIDNSPSPVMHKPAVSIDNSPSPVMHKPAVFIDNSPMYRRPAHSKSMPPPPPLSSSQDSTPVLRGRRGSPARRLIDDEASCGGQTGSSQWDESESDMDGFIDDSTPTSGFHPPPVALLDSPLHVIRFGNRQSALSMPIIEATIRHMQGRGLAPEADTKLLQEMLARQRRAELEEQAEVSDTLDPDESVPRTPQALPVRPIGMQAVYAPVDFCSRIAQEPAPEPRPLILNESAPSEPRPLDAETRRRIEEKKALALQRLRDKQPLVWRAPSCAADVLGVDSHVMPAMVDADVCLSARVGLLLMDQHVACADAQAVEMACSRLLSRYSAGCLVLVASPDVGCLTAQTSQLAAHLRALILWLKAMVGLRVLVASSKAQVGLLIKMLADKEMAEGWGLPRDVDASSDVVRFLATARSSNPAVAAKLVLAHRGTTLRQLLAGLSGDAVKAAVPGLTEVQVSKLCLFFKRKWAGIA